MLGTVAKVVNFNRLSSSCTVASVRRKVRYNTAFLQVCHNRGYVVSSSIKTLKCFYKSNVIHLRITAKYSTENKYPKYSEHETLSSTNVQKRGIFEQELSAVEFEKISNETLESLTEYFDEIVEEAVHLKDADISYGDGVLTVKFGDPYGTYVLNRQTPNKQIWLSSPKSGPKRYDFINNKWIYKHDGKSLHELLDAEIPDITKSSVSFKTCSYAGKED